MVAISAATRVERDQEETGPFDPLQHRARAVGARDGVAQIDAQPIQDRRAQQELSHLVGLVIENLRGQIVDEVSVVAGEGRDELVGVVGLPEAEGGDVERGHPSFGAAVQRVRLRVADIDLEAFYERGPGPRPG